ncbi:serine hydrolase [Paenibacillus graminis]|uniref:serine hydrolase n=1 Tax=Paenibacillus graminis TaxID=189425 RepID=UPI002DBFF489|nr:serine hydrolase [Paenibacillus graminis]MEC0168036.1 beta-lactamase family protein [Paenibacillus graminis]
MKKLILPILAAALFLPTGGIASDPQASPSAVKLDKAEAAAFAAQFFEQKEVKEQLAGALLVIVKDGQVLLNKGYGYADMATKRPIDADKTLFRLASVSKLFTSAGIMQLAEAGKVDLDKDVQTYLPDLQIPNTTGAPLTLKHLMTHTTGFDNTDSLDSDKAYTLKDYLKNMMPTVVRKPGEAFRYDNFAFTLQGYIIEKISGLTFQDYVRKNMFKPLGMDRSSFIFNDEVRKAIATPHNNNLEPIAQIPNVPDNSPQGGMFSTGADMAKFMLAMLNGGQAGGERFLTEASINAMEHTSVTIHPDIPGVGYAFETNYPKDYNGYTVVEKGGDLAGFHSNLWLMPGQNTGMFLALNSDKGNLRLPFFEQFMSRYFPKTDAGPAFVKPAPDKQQLLRFEGLYRHLRTPVLRYDITAADGALIVRDALGTHTLRQAGDLLFYDEEGTPAGFKLDADGNIVYFSYNMPDSWAEKIPEPAKFSDVPEAHPYAKSIYYLVQLGALPGGTAEFKPDMPITRGQFLAQLMPLAGFQLSTQPSVFSDTKGSPYEAAIQTAADYGIVQGLPVSIFGPNQALTREQAATFIWRMVKISLNAAPVKSDLRTPASPWASEGVQYIVGQQLFGPDVQAAGGALEYRPKDQMLNKEAAELIYKLIQKLF